VSNGGVVALAQLQDCARADETNPGDDLRRHTRLFRTRKGANRQTGEQASSEAHQHMRS